MADKRPIRTDVPHSARIWNYWLGGRDYYEADRLAGEAAVAGYPEIKTLAMQSRQFLIRVVRYLAAEAGVRQFLDIGTGLPTMQNTHEVAQSAAPDSRIVYVDNDPLVLAHARALLVNTTDEGVTTYLEADFNDPEMILADARHVLNFGKPIAIMYIGVLGHARSYDQVRRVVNTMMDGVPSGSYLALYDGATDDKAYVRMCENYAKTGGVPYIPRSSAEITGIFDGLELVEPGVVPINHWRTDDAAEGVRGASAWGGVGRKP
ncbi:S-adenosyl methyltransferase [Nocardia amikacinitolerans]|uniref:S-adenosyl methyltransferase n=1 Tax=Nocardia amikacinitolerans TaxID=756689 RepID=A0A285KQ72_9NOCA|nr:SAM-dependent methyltransferase [Nocardia amikacinitolerans]MCP2275492.1 S-adenosyl methyltransferase [Nocardia amikacinitolerans]MCP2293752.1 S-adenosyl methyltransferase [Nocardia amikacinitolerans]SNY74765.1 S-adenosyl methyltransferase [Nocardia amikacinitolerans]